MASQKQQAEQNNRLRQAQQEFNDAYAAYSSALNIMDDREMLFRGTKTVDGNVNDSSIPPNGRKKANNVRNICREFVETLVDTTIPQPIIKAKTAENQPLAITLEESLKSDLSEVNIERQNDYQERTTHIQGMSLFEVYWDKTRSTHTSIGDINIRLVHPKQFIPYPNVWDIQKMPYFFTRSSVTKSYIKQRYGVDVEEETEAQPDANSLSGATYSSATSSNVTEVVKWYKDEDGDVGRLVWVNDIVLEDIPKFFYRKDEKGNNLQSFALQEDYQKPTGNMNPDGTPEMETVIPQYTQVGTDETGQPITVPTQIPYFVPDKYPFVLRENTPLDFQFGGESDIDVIRDQQDAVKKVGSRIEEKIMSVCGLVMIPDDPNVRPDNSAVKIVKIKPGQQSIIDAKSLQPDISKDVTFYEQQIDAAKDTLGITPALQGQPDASARSATAKQLQINQSSARLNSIRANKVQAYKELFEIMFQFKLAYMDEARPYVTRGEDGNPKYSEFNRLDFLKQDAAGQWYYDTDFIINADANGGLPSDRTWLLSQALQLLQYQAFGQVQDPNARLMFWQMLSTINFPGAQQIKAQLEKTIQQSQQTMQAQQGGVQGQAGQGSTISPQILQTLLGATQGVQQNAGGVQ